MNANKLHIRILKPGLYTTIQDGGRYGFRQYAIPNSGCLDQEASKWANIIVGNDENAALIECNMIGPSIAFDESAIIAITGADMQWQLDGVTKKRYKVISVRAGQILSSKSGINGMRGYLAINGEIQVQSHYGSQSTYDYAQLGGLSGSRLNKNEKLVIRKIANTKSISISSKPYDYNSLSQVAIQPGPEWSLFSVEEQSKLLQSTYTISADSNRMGSKLDCIDPIYHDHQLNHSNCIIPGMIQLPKSGKPIVILQDGQTTGGYPRIAFIPRKALNLFSQIKPRQEFKLVLQ